MPTASTFPACCGVNIISGFMYDDEMKDAQATDTSDWWRQELTAFPQDMKSAEGTYCHCHLVALTPEQKLSGEMVEELGYRPVGTFRSRDGPYQVTLYAKGLTLLGAKKPKKSKKKPKKLNKRR